MIISLELTGWRYADVQLFMYRFKSMEISAHSGGASWANSRNDYQPVGLFLS